jgi:hypothetical protein
LPGQLRTHLVERRHLAVFSGLSARSDRDAEGSGADRLEANQSDCFGWTIWPYAGKIEKPWHHKNYFASNFKPITPQTHVCPKISLSFFQKICFSLCIPPHREQLCCE